MSNKIFLLRHYDRIDQDPERCPPAETKRWNSDMRRKPFYNINPYLCSGNRVDQTVRELAEMGDICFDYVFCSPFVRCIETAMQIMKASPDKFRNKNINIDFCLSEFIDEIDPFPMPFNVKDLYTHSKTHLETYNPDYSTFTLVDYNTSLTFADYENMEQYKDRIKSTVGKLRSSHGGNILIVTHAFAIKPFSSSISGMSYGPLYDITTGSVGGNYYEKYMKYKLKYLKLKSLQT